MTSIGQTFDRLTLVQTTIASSATPTPTGSAKENELYITALEADAEFAAPTGTAVNGNTLMIRAKAITDDRALTYNAIYNGFVAALPATLLTDKTIYMKFVYNSATTKWDLISVVNEA